MRLFLTVLTWVDALLDFFSIGSERVSAEEAERILCAVEHSLDKPLEAMRPILNEVEEEMLKEMKPAPDKVDETRKFIRAHLEEQAKKIILEKFENSRRKK